MESASERHTVPKGKGGDAMHTYSHCINLYGMRRLKTYKFLQEFKVRGEHVGFMKMVIFVCNLKKMVFQFERVGTTLKAKVNG